MLSLLVALAFGQIHTDTSPRQPIRIDSPSAQLQELSELRHLAVSLRTQLNLSRQVTELSVEIATFDTSGPGWAKSLRVISYLLALPAFVFIAPVWSGKSLAVGAISLFSSAQTQSTMTPTVNLVGVVLAIVVGASFVIGVAGGFIGWLNRTIELESLVQQKAALNEQWAALRIEGDSFALRR